MKEEARERSKILLTVAPADARQKTPGIAELCRELFAQEPVLLSSSAAEARSVRRERVGGDPTSRGRRSELSGL